MSRHIPGKTILLIVLDKLQINMWFFLGGFEEYVPFGNFSLRVLDPSPFILKTLLQGENGREIRQSWLNRKSLVRKGQLLLTSAGSRAQVLHP